MIVERRWKLAYLLMYAAYVVVGTALRYADWMHGDALVYVQASRRVVDGSFDLYSLLRTPWIAPPLGTTYAYSPFMAIFLAPLVGVGDALRLGNIGVMKLIGIPLLFGDVLAMQQLRRLAREWRPLVRERSLFLGIGLSLFFTSFLLVTAYKSHIEGMVMLFVLLALRLLPRSLMLSGLCAGMALSAKHMTALLCLIPIGLALFLNGRSRTPGEDGSVQGRSNRLRDGLDWGVIAVGVFAAFMLPAVIANPTAVQYALITQAQRIVPLGPGMPRWVNALLESNMSPEAYASVRPTVLSLSNLPLVGVVSIVSLVVVWLLRKRGRPVGIVDVRLLGLVAFGGMSYVLFGKWVSENYYQMPLALLFLWDVVRTAPRSTSEIACMRSFPWVGIGSEVVYGLVALFSPPFVPLWGEPSVQFWTDLFLFGFFAGLCVVILRWVVTAEPTAPEAYLSEPGVI